MSAEIAPGVWVEPGDAEARNLCGTSPRLVLAVVPTASYAVCISCGQSTDSLVIKGLPLPTNTLGWCIRHWRPVHRPRAEFLAELMEPMLGMPKIREVVDA